MGGGAVPGGADLGGLIQDGTAMNENIPAPDGTVPLYAPWYEILNNSKGSNFGPDYLGSFKISAGDSIHTYMSYSSDNTTADFYIADNSTGQPGAFDWDIALATLKYGSYYDGVTDLWIVEDSDSGSVPLANYGSVDWTNAQAELSNGNWQAVVNGNPGQVNMTSGSTLLSKTSNLNSDGQSWTNTWKACS